MPLNQLAEKEVIVLTGVIDPDYQGEIRLLFHNGGKEERVCLEYGRPFRTSLSITTPCVKVNGKLQKPKPSTTATGPDPSRIKFQFIPPGKETQPGRCFMKAKGIQNG